MIPNHHRTHLPKRRAQRLALAAAAGLVSAILATGCGGSGKAVTGQPSASRPAVLPVTSNPINNTATEQTLQIASVLVEDNVNPVTGKAAHDHLEIRFANTGTADLVDVEVYYSFHDPKTGATENYYSKLPADFAVPAGGVHTAHFDDIVAPDHVPVNKFSLYYTDTNPLNVTVVASAKGAAVQTKTLGKDAGGVETAD